MLACSCSERESGAPAVRLGYLQSDLHHLPAFVALEKGFFAEEGVQVQVAGIFKAGPEEMSAFAAGALDIGYVGQAPATAALLNGVADVVFIAQVNLEGSSVVGHKAAGCDTIKCLAGKTVAIPGHATMQDFLFRKAVAENGLTQDKPGTIVLKPPEMLQALEQKNIDAFIAWEPYPSQAINSGTGTVVASSHDIWPGHPCCVLIASRKLCTGQPDIIKKIQAAHRRACDFIAAHEQEAVAIGMKYTGMDRSVVIRALKNIIYSPRLEKQKALEFVDFLKEQRYVKPRNAAATLQDFFFN